MDHVLTGPEGCALPHQAFWAMDHVLTDATTIADYADSLLLLLRTALQQQKIAY